MKLSQMKIENKVYYIKSHGETDSWQIFSDPAGTRIVSLSSTIEKCVATFRAKLFPVDQTDRDNIRACLAKGVKDRKGLIDRYDWDTSQYRYGRSETDIQKAKALAEEKNKWLADIKKEIKHIEAEMERMGRGEAG